MATISATTVSPDTSAEHHLRAGDPLLGRRILIVEDDPYIALALEETLTEFGVVVVGTARSVQSALDFIRNIEVDLALLDVNLGDERIDPVADALKARHRAFVFTSGYGRAGLPEAYADRPMVEKPFYIEEILRALRDAATDRPSHA